MVLWQFTLHSSREWRKSSPKCYQNDTSKHQKVPKSTNKRPKSCKKVVKHAHSQLVTRSTDNSSGERVSPSPTSSHISITIDRHLFSIFFHCFTSSYISINIDRHLFSLFSQLIPLIFSQPGFYPRNSENTFKPLLWCAVLDVHAKFEWNIMMINMTWLCMTMKMMPMMMLMMTCPKRLDWKKLALKEPLPAWSMHLVSAAWVAGSSWWSLYIMGECIFDTEKLPFRIQGILSFLLFLDNFGQV